MIRFIENIGDFFATNYFDEDFTGKVIDKSGYDADGRKAIQKRLHALKERYYRYKQVLLEGRLREKEVLTETHQWHSQLLRALGYPESEAYEWHHLGEGQVVPVRQRLYRGTQPHLYVLEMSAHDSDR